MSAPKNEGSESYFLTAPIDCLVSEVEISSKLIQVQLKMLSLIESWKLREKENEVMKLAGNGCLIYFMNSWREFGQKQVEMWHDGLQLDGTFYLHKDKKMIYCYDPGFLAQKWRENLD